MLDTKLMGALSCLEAHLMTEVCHNVAVELHVQLLTGETLREASANTQDGARLDVAADGFWGGRYERAFFDVKVFSPYAPLNRRSTLQAVYRSHENIKREEIVRPKNQRSGTRDLFPTGVLMHRRHESCRHSHLQEIGRPDRRKKR